MTRGSTPIDCNVCNPLKKYGSRVPFPVYTGFHHPRSLHATVLQSPSLPVIKFYRIITWHSFLRNMTLISI